MSKTIRGIALGLAFVLGAVACTSPDRPTVQAQTVDLPTPISSPGVAATNTVEQIRGALAAVPIRLVEPVGAYRPSEPESLLQAARVVMRADLADPDDGFVVIYDLPDADTADDRAQDLAAYLGSGFGQTNYPADAQFSVGVVGPTVVFTWWARRRASDPAKGEAVFDAVASVGDKVEVLK